MLSSDLNVLKKYLDDSMDHTIKLKFSPKKK